MFKLAGTSLLFGFVAVALGICLYFAGKSPAIEPPVLPLDLAAARVDAGAGTAGAGGLRLELDATGLGVVVIPPAPMHAGDYPFLHLLLSGQEADALVAFWKTSTTGDTLLHYSIPGALSGGIWQSMEASGDWRGDIVELGFVIKGKAGERLTLESAELVPASVATQMRFLASQWLAPAPWRHSSVNDYAGTRSAGAALYPVPVIAIAISLALLCYVFLVSRQGRVDLGWRGVSAIFLAGWVALDLLWQGRLLWQLGETRSRYAGKASAEKLAVGPDARLVAFTEKVKRQLASPDSRVFVSSDDDFYGMRGAYYLYPYNVFWRRGDPGLPAQGYIHPGDYIVVVKPTELRFDLQANVLSTPGGATIPVNELASDDTGSLFRVM